jgi:hypothetical protein
VGEGARGGVHSHAKDSNARKGYLILPDARDAKVLLRTQGARWRLPEISLASPRPWGYETQQITLQVREALGLECTVLRCIESCEPFALTDRLEAFVIEGQQLNWMRPSGTDWFGPDELDELGFVDERHGEVVRSYFGDQRGESSPPWARHGWMGSARSWLDSEFDRLGLALVGRIEQVRWSSVASVLRVPTEGRQLYLKTCTDPIEHEPELTAALSREFPRLLPRVLASDAKRRFLLTEDAGQPTTLEPERAEWLLRALAELQVHCTERPERLLELGCPDWRPAQLRSGLESALAELRAQLELSSTLPRRVLLRLSQRAAALDQALMALAQAEVPCSLDHPDFASRSCMVRGNELRMLGWNGALTHPFFAPSSLIEEFTAADVRERLLGAYLQAWGGFAPSERLLQIYASAREVEPVYRALQRRARLCRATSSAERALERAELEDQIRRLTA